MVASGLRRPRAGVSSRREALGVVARAVAPHADIRGPDLLIPTSAQHRQLRTRVRWGRDEPRMQRLERREVVRAPQLDPPETVAPSVAGPVR
jgi:hypothetical protein